MLIEFFAKKVIGNFVFWMCCAIAYLIFHIIGVTFFQSSNISLGVDVLKDLSMKIDLKFIMILCLAMVFSTFLGFIVQSVQSKTKGGFEIVRLANESAYGQFVSFGSISFAISLFMFLKNTIPTWNPHFTQENFKLIIAGFSYWAIAFVVFFLIESLIKKDVNAEPKI